MDNLKPKRYHNPIDEKTGLPYFVPCVAKNKDALIYYVHGMGLCINSVMNIINIQDTIKLDLNLTSLRFTDILPDGKRISELLPKDYEKMEAEATALKQEHPDNNVKRDTHFLSLTCQCGNYYVFKQPHELPDDTFFCGLCDKVLIDYTDTDDWDFEFRK